MNLNVTTNTLVLNAIIGNDVSLSLVQTTVTLTLKADYGVSLGENAQTAYRGDKGKEAYDHSKISGNPHETSREDIIDLGIEDEPEFADVNITNLKSVTSGGGVEDVKAIWLGATANSVLSYISKLIDKVFNLYPQVGVTFTGSIDLTKVDTHYSDYSQTGVLEITIAVNPIVGGSAEVTITANGSAITVAGAIQYGDTAIDYTAAKINHFLFTKFEHGVYYAVKQLN